MSNYLSTGESSRTSASQTSSTSMEQFSRTSDDSPERNKKTFLRLPRIHVHNYSLVLENSGSVARDHLANERTFLAWIRTAMTTMTFGLAFVQMYAVQVRALDVIYHKVSYSIDVRPGLHTLHLLGRPVGILMGVFALVMVLFGFARYFHVQAGLQHGQMPVSRYMALAVVTVCTLLSALVLALDIKVL